MPIFPPNQVLERLALQQRHGLERDAALKLWILRIEDDPHMPPLPRT